MTKIPALLVLLLFLPGLADAQTKVEEAVASNNRGIKLLKEGKADEAIAEFQKAVQLDPNYTPARQNLGYAYDRQGRSEEAMVHYQKAVELDPKSPVVYNNLGVLYDKERRYDEAMAEFEKALRVNPGDATALKNLETAKKNKAFIEEREKAIAQAQKAVENNPKDPRSAYNLARLYALHGQKEQAIEWLAKALKLGYRDLDYLKVDPALKSLRDDSNFIRLFPTR